MNGKTIGFILAALLMLSACRRIQRLDRPYADNPEMQEKVRKSFNLAIALPADMQSSKLGKDFFWLSNNAASGMKNVVIYRIRSCNTLPLSVERFCELRDSVMKINIKGEEDSMHVATVKASVKGRFYPKSRRCRYEGLWEMKGDAWVVHSSATYMNGLTGAGSSSRKASSMRPKPTKRIHFSVSFVPYWVQ